MIHTVFDISGKVSIHDIHQFEVKLEYNLEELQQSNKYKVEAYFFIPSSLNINAGTYPKKEFYADLQNYIRFKTPSYSFKLILDPDFTRSPLYALKSIRDELTNEKDHNKQAVLIKQAVKELKLLGYMVRARLQDFKSFMYRKLKKSKRDEAYLFLRLENTLNRSIRILEELRSLRKQFLNLLQENSELFKYFQLVDEFISNLYEEEMIGIFNLAQNEMHESPQIDSLLSFFKDFLQKEEQYRLENNFSLIFKNDDKGKESYLYYMGKYKKIIASVLYLDVVRDTKDAAYYHIIGSTAAFIASVFYFFITYLISFRVAINSIPFFMLLSFGYVFKDRIKDILKTIFKPSLNFYLHDHNTKIIDSEFSKKHPLGFMRETVYYSHRDKLDKSIISLRENLPRITLPEEPQEEILVYQKEIQINNARVKERHSRTINFTDIMRFNLQKYMLKMDDPEQRINYYDKENEQFASTAGNRVYHINMILKYSKFQGKSEQMKMEKYRIIVSKKGIIRIEFLGGI